MCSPDGTKVVFHGPDEPPAPPEDGHEDDGAHDAMEWRVMDCIDCHNRPSHVYKLPAQELDTAMEQGLIAADLPYVKREGMRLLQEEWGSHDEARQAIPAALSAFYADSYPDLVDARADEISAAAEASGRPALVLVHSNIGFGSPKQDTSGVHGSPTELIASKTRTPDGRREFIERSRLLDQLVQHGNHRRDPDSRAQQHDGPRAMVEYEVASGRAGRA